MKSSENAVNLSKIKPWRKTTLKDFQQAKTSFIRDWKQFWFCGVESVQTVEQQLEQQVNKVLEEAERQETAGSDEPEAQPNTRFN